VVHQARIVRIRALDGVHLYSVLLRLSHWTPVGNYSVVLSGPGFQWTSSEAVRVGPQVVSVDMPGVNQTGEGEWLLQNRSGTEWRGVIDLVTGGDAGIQMIQPDGSVAQLVSATFARCTRNCSFRNARLLGFSVAIPPGESHIRVVRTALHSPLKVSIAHVTPEGSLEAIREHALRAVVSETPVSILWDFLDGDGGAGVEIRHRWTDSLSMRARIHGFDREGRVVSGCLARRMQVSHRSFSGFCSFQTTGRSAHSLLKLLLF
jgi:hypothetical protein